MNTTFSISNAYEIAKILFACSIIAEDEIIEITDQLMSGNFQPRKQDEKESEEASQER